MNESKTDLIRSDGELLTAFVESRDEDAFAQIVDRHHRHLLMQCNLFLKDRTEAEDASQSVFMVLADRAKSLKAQRCLARWLHGVARKVCLHIRRTEAARNRRITKLQSFQPGGLVKPPADGRQQEALQKALADLPERYRLPVMLHFLSGHSFREIGTLLDCKPSTISTRISRGRERLRKHLARQGVVLSMARMVSLPSQDPWTKGPSSTFVQACSQAAMALAMDKPIAGIVGENVQTLMKGVQHMMFMKKMKTLAIAFLALAVFAGGSAVLMPRMVNQAEAGVSFPIPAHIQPAIDQLVARYYQPGDIVTVTQSRIFAGGWNYVQVTVTKASGEVVWISGRQPIRPVYAIYPTPWGYFSGSVVKIKSGVGVYGYEKFSIKI